MTDESSLCELELSPRVWKCIDRQVNDSSGLTVGWLRERMTTGDIISWRNFGIKSYNEVANLLGLPTQDYYDADKRKFVKWQH